ncbi:MAG: anaerobic ribonucleoside-triphosphate reductase [Cetobacterium sp.]
MQVIKRNSTKVNFDSNKIKLAIEKAKKQINSVITEQEIQSICDSVSKLNSDQSVESIQDLVVKKLMGTKHKDLAVAYQSYRVLRADARLKEQQIYKQVGQLIDASNEDMMNENANKDSKTISVQRDLLAGITSKEYYLNHILPASIRELHKEGSAYLHDLDYLIFKEFNCEVFDLGKMLHGGCKIGNAPMGEPNSIDVAVGHMIQIIASISSNTYGGCSVPYMDRDLVPYVRKTFFKQLKKGIKWVEQKEIALEQPNEFYFVEDWTEYYKAYSKLYPKAYEYAIEQTEEAVEQAMQALEYEINSLSTVNGLGYFGCL